MPQSSSQSKTPLYIIAGLPIAVILLATLVFFSGIGMPTSTSNQGVLVHPARSLENTGISFSVDTPLKKPVWTLLHIAPDRCMSQCEEVLEYSRQIRTSLGRRTPGLRRLLWVDDPEANRQRFEEVHPDLDYQTIPSIEKRKELLSDLGDKNLHQFYLIDPRGFLMMYYTEEQNYKQIIKDLKFLLTQSGY